MIVGAVIRIELLSGPAGLLPGDRRGDAPDRRLAGRSARAGRRGAPAAAASRRIVGAALLVGVIGGIYGIGGGSILAPPLVGLGFSVAEVAPAALASTFLTSIVGVVTYAVISLRHSGSIAPDWVVGMAIGVGGLLGGYVGTGLRDRVPEAALRRTLGIVAMLLAVRYLTLAVT